MKRIGFALLISAVLAGCAAPTHRIQYKASPTKIENQIDFIEASISPDCTSWGCESFTLFVRNKSEKTIEINWNKTLFLSYGQSSGGFMFEGVVYRDRNASKSPDVVFSNGTLSKTIWPNNLVEFTSGKYGGWKHNNMPSGNIGVYLTVTMDGKDFSQKITTNVSAEQVAIPK